MKKYDEYKDSGVAWIGEVPKHWEVIKLKYKYHFQTGATPNTGKKENFEGELRWANISDLNGSVVYDTTKHINKEAASKCSMNISPKGSLMYSFKLSVGTVAFCGEDMYTNEAIASFIPQKNDLKYLFYCAPIFIIHNANRNIYNAPLLNQELIKNALICLPSLNEQTAIAAYLDTHCAKIDNLISIQQKRIALLQELKQSVITHAVTKGLNPNVEMKPSGIEWIGDVPKHWEVMPLKHLAVLYPKSVCSNNKENIVSYAPMENVRNDKLTEDEKKITELTSGLNTFYEGDILMAKVTPCFENGNIAIAHSLKHSLGYCSSELFVIRVKRINVRYLFFLLQNQDYKQVCLSTLTGTGGLKRVSADFVRSGKMPVPSQEEQAAIASYLDRKCATIDTSISNAQHQIELLQEYKQSLITEVVTGKRKVTDN